jgi:2-polyprenyl-3-methyl-5-hydroxy-6-metoxy-1,4-benzoquinol methylase
LTRGLAFLGQPPPTDYGSRLSHLRWRHAARADVVAELSGEDSAAPIIGSAGSWVLVREPAALPRPGSRIPEPPYRRVLLAEAGVPEPPSFVHTLRELEATRLDAAAGSPDGWTPALAFWSADFPPGAEESIQAFWERLRGLDASSRATDANFRAIRFEEPSRLERPELTRRLPDGALRVLDVGCGAAGGIASARSRERALTITGIERDPGLAAQARERCDRVEEGDLREVLPRLAREGERFDALIFADVLEHLDDPVAPLHAARTLAAPRARLLVSVPNVGHLSVVRDLLLGRFDPVPAGLLDAGHLRWFTREYLAQILEEAGWRIDSIESEPGAPSPDPEPLRRLAELWPDVDSESLGTYQWIAQAHPE